MVNALSQVLKRPTDILTRYGGEEFFAILPNTPDIKQLAEECRAAIENLCMEHANSKFVTITIGCGVFNIADDTSPAEILESIDQALYSGKSQGKNQVVMV